MKRILASLLGLALLLSVVLPVQAQPVEGAVGEKYAVVAKE